MTNTTPTVAARAQWKGYAASIMECLTKMGRTDINPRHVEGWMRSEHHVLDGLTPREFTREVKIAVQCIDSKPLDDAGRDVSEVLARPAGPTRAEDAVNDAADDAYDNQQEG